MSMLLRRYHEPAPAVEEAEAAPAVESDPVEVDTPVEPEAVEADPAEAETINPWPEGEPSEKWRTAEIDAYADARGIDVSGAGNKAEKVEVIRAHTAN